MNPLQLNLSETQFRHSRVTHLLGEVLCWLGQSLSFVAMIRFTESISSREGEKGRFELPASIAKGVFAALFFGAGTALSVITFAVAERAPLRCSALWSEELLKAFLVCAIVIWSLGLVWIVWLLLALRTASAKLRAMPHGHTRFRQLGFTFFAMQTFIVAVLGLVGIILECTALFDVFFTSSKASAASGHLPYLVDTLTVVLKLRSRKGAPPPGRMLYPTTAVGLLLRLFLPPNPAVAWQRELATTYVRQEAQIESLRRLLERETARRPFGAVPLGDILHNGLEGGLLAALSGIGTRFGMRPSLARPSMTRTAKTAAPTAVLPVFCLETAIRMSEISLEAYNDVAGMKTAGGWEEVDLARLRCELVGQVLHEPVTETHAMLVRDVDPRRLERARGQQARRRRLIIAFRGSASYADFVTNKQFQATNVDLASLERTEHFSAVLLSKLQRAASTRTRGATSADDSAEAAARDRQAALKSEQAALSGAFAVQDGDAIEAEARAHLRDEARSVLTGLSDKDAADTALRSIATTLPSQSGDVLLERVVDWHLAALRPHSDEGAEGRRRSDDARSAAPARAAKIPRPTGGVHAGFLGAYNSVRLDLHRELMTELQARPGEYDEIAVTGHSLGGALATLCVLDLRTNVLPLVNARLRDRRKRRLDYGIAAARSEAVEIGTLCYTFGSPRVGDHDFARYFQARVPHVFRVAMDGDIVTGVPPKKILPYGYKHIGVRVVLDRPNEESGAAGLVVDPNIVESTFRLHFTTSIAAHSTEGYIEALKLCLGEEAREETDGRAEVV